MGYAILLCAVASLSTGIGGAAVALYPRMSLRGLAFFQGFAAGVMTGISFMEMLPESFVCFCETKSVCTAAVYIAVLFAVGWSAAAAVSAVSLHENSTGKKDGTAAAKRVCLITTAVIVLHNLPEGMLTCFTGYGNPSGAGHIVLAVALHNIPEGIAVASSVLYITKSGFKAFLHSFVAGLCELFGGVAALFVMHSFVTPQFVCGTMAVISGIMVQVSLCQLLSAGTEIYSKKAVYTGFTAGVVAIAIGILTI